MAMIVRTRVAPSPTGDPHVGTLYQALFDYILARQNKGEFILRIEDTDRKRFVLGSEGRIIRALDWAGLKPDIGPIRQSERLPLYQKYAKELIAKGSAYYCFCTQEKLEEVRKEQEKNHQPPRYNRHCRNIPQDDAAARVAAGEPFVIRMVIPDGETIVIHDELRGEVAFNSNLIDEQVLLKSDGFPTYHLAATVDDYEMGVTHVFRGEEWLPSSPKHILLYRYFGWPEPKWFHLPDLRNSDHSKLSKRKNNTSVEFYINEGYLPEALLNFLLLCVWGREKGKEKFSLTEAIAEFDVKKTSLAAPVFDVVKLDWLNGEYIRSLSDEVLLSKLRDFYGASLPEKQLTVEIVSLVKDRLKKLSEFKELTSFLVADSVLFDKSLLKHSSLLSKLLTKLSAISMQDWSHEGLEVIIRQTAEEENLPAKELFMDLRLAITGKTVTPPLLPSMLILGKENSLKRLANACEV